MSHINARLFGIPVQRGLLLTTSARAEMTFPSVVRLLLILAPSFRRVPLAPVESALSDPARSTSEILLTFSVESSVVLSRRCWVKNMVNTACDRLEVSFMFVAATVLKGISQQRGMRVQGDVQIVFILSTFLKGFLRTIQQTLCLMMELTNKWDMRDLTLLYYPHLWGHVYLDMKWQQALKGPPHMDQVGGVLLHVGFPCSWDWAGLAHVHSKFPCNSPEIKHSTN